MTLKPYLLRSFCFGLLLLASAAQSSAAFHLKVGDRVVCYGASITGAFLRFSL